MERLLNALESVLGAMPFCVEDMLGEEDAALYRRFNGFDDDDDEEEDVQTKED